MAVLGRLLVSSAERLDLPDLLSLDSYAAGDWKFFLKGLVGDSKPFILKGFDVIDPGNAIGTQSCSIRVADSVTFYPGSNSGAFFHGLQEGHEQAAPLVPELRKNAVNFVYLTFSTFNTSVDTRAFWDPDKDGGVGGEFTQDVNTESVLQVQVNVSTGSFPANTVPVAKITVGPVVITAIEDARDMMFRLGSGGIAPNPFNLYAWRSLPGSPYQRTEPATQMLAGGVNPFQGADKNILSLKEWMDAVMSKLRELGGTTYWYEDTSSFGIVTNFFDAVGTTFKSKGQWLHDTTTAGMLTWSEDINIKMTSDPRTYIIRQGSKTLSNEQVMYVPMIRNKALNVTDDSVSWTNGQAYVNTVGGAIAFFANLSKGDYVKKANDSFDKWLRVEEFYDAVNLGGSVTTAPFARSIRLSSNYLGTTGVEKGRYDKGAYLPADVTVSDRNVATIANTGGNFHWLAMRSDTIENTSSLVSHTLSLAISDHDGATAKVTSAAHGLVDGDRITITGTTNFNGTYKVEVETTSIFYITKSGGPFANESGSGFFATVTTVARSTPYSFQEESANHGFNTDDTIIIAATTNYNGSKLINVLSPTTFTIPMSAAFATETSGTATLARVIVRNEGTGGSLIQGEIVNIGGNVADNVRQYLGMASLSQTAPIYAIAPGYNTLDGMENWNGTVNENITARVSKLTAMMADKAQDKTIKILPSGYESVTNTVNGASQDITFNAFVPPGRLDIAMPGSDYASNSLLLTGTLSLLANQAAYITLDRNNTTAFANLAAVSVANITSVPVDENVFIIAVRLGTQEVWLWDGLYVSAGATAPVPGYLAQIVNQNNTAKLVRGGIWSWTLSSTTLAWSLDAYMQVSNLTEVRNTILAGSAVLAADGDVAYVDIHRNTGGAANLTVSVAPIATLALNADRFIIARRTGSTVIVGAHSMLLVDGETKPLYAGMSNESLSALGLSSESDHGQLRLLKNYGASSKRIIITPTDVVVPDGTTFGNEISGLLMSNPGFQIDLETGNYYQYGDGTLAGSGALIGSLFTPTAFTSPNLFRWYSVNLVADTANANGTINVKPLLLAGTDNTSGTLATHPPFASKKLGQVLVQAPGTGSTINNIVQTNIVQLGTGAGGGGGSTPKMIGGGTWAWDSVTFSLTFTSDIYIEQPRLNYVDNTILAAVSPIVLPTVNHVAYIDRLNASSGGPALTVLIDLITNVKDGQIIIARRDGFDVIVGSTSFRLTGGESKKGDAGTSNELLNVIPASNNGDATGQLRLVKNTVTPKRVNVTNVSKTVPDGTEYGMQLQNLLLSFTGAQIAFDTGIIYQADGVTALGVNFTPATIAASQYRWYSVTLVPSTVLTDNRITGQLIIIAGSADGATPLLAPKAAFSSGINLGEVVVQDNGAGGVGTINNILQTAIVQLAASGSGSSSTPTLDYILRDRFLDSDFEYLEENLFSSDQSTKVDLTTVGPPNLVSTGSYSFAKGAWFLSSIGQTMVSYPMLDPTFLTQGVDITEVELYLQWLSGFVDNAATYEISRDGGTNWSTMTMSLIGLGDYRGYYTFSDEVTQQSLQTYANSNSDTNSSLTGSGSDQARAQKFTVTSTEVLRSMDIYLNKVQTSGTVAGKYKISIIKDSAGSPSLLPQDNISESDLLNASSLSVGLNTVTVTMPQVVMVPGDYWIVYSTDADYKASYSAAVRSIDVRSDTSPFGTGTPASAYQFNGTVWAVSAGPIALVYLLKGRVHDLRVRVTSGTVTKYIEGYGVYYGLQSGVTSTNGEKRFQKFYFTGDSNTTDFTLTFTPDPELLEILDPYRGQSYAIEEGVARIIGQVVRFEPNTFNFPGENIVLIFRQVKGSTIDNNNANAVSISTINSNLVDVGNQLAETQRVSIPLLTVANTTIVNRAQIPDPSQDLKPRLGIDRVMVQNIFQLQNEFGPNGEPVWGVLNDDRGLIRFVGPGFSNANSTAGIGAYTSSIDDYIEIAFYGTGLNYLTQIDGGARDNRYAVDGAAYVVLNILPTSPSGILNNRNYSMNCVVPVVSGLTLGIHTVKIKNNIAANGLTVHGFEILNENQVVTTGNTHTSTLIDGIPSTAALAIGMTVSGSGVPSGATISSVDSATQVTISAATTSTLSATALTFAGSLKINPGISYNAGKKLTLASAQTQSYKSGFETGTLGTRGGRVLVYQKSDGTVAKAVQPTDAAQANLTSTNHANEEVTRTHYWREFGASRSPTDDFSKSFTTANGMFTLDDGTTTLTTDVSNSTTINGYDVLQVSNTGTNFITLTFVGTGLDILATFANTNTTTGWVFTIDGVAAGTLTLPTSTAITKNLKIVSGLPYGTHTVKFVTNATGAGNYGIVNYKVYGPKKPTLPSGALELADYNIMANFVANTVVGFDSIATGVLRKASAREWVYVNGTGGSVDWTANTSPGNSTNGLSISTDRLNANASYTFFGTGFDFRFRGNTGKQNAQLLLNGINLTTANYPSATTSVTAGTTTFTPSTGILALGSVASVFDGSLTCTGLPLALYTFKINEAVAGAGGNGLDIDCIDIITPIHSPKSNIYADLQNTLLTGSCGISDNRPTKTIKELTTLPNKAWAQAIGISSSPTTTSTSLVPMPDMSCTVKTIGGPLKVSFAGSGQNSTGGFDVSCQLYIDGVSIGSAYCNITTSTATYRQALAFNTVVPVSAGVHKIDVYWGVNGNTGTMQSTIRTLTVEEK